MKRQTPSIVIDRLGTHLNRITNNHTGQVTLSWDWDRLLAEVRAATSGTPAKVKAAPKKPTAAKKDLVKETETKVAKTRVKKAEEKIGITKTKSSAKKPATKKTPATKPSTKK